MLNIATCKNDETTKKLIENINNNIFAKPEKDGKIKYLGLSKGINFEENLFKSEVGKYLDKFENVNKDYTLAILSGLTMPFKRIKSINEKITAEKETIINLSKVTEIKLESISFLDEIEQTAKKVQENMTADEILANLF